MNTATPVHSEGKYLTDDIVRKQCWQPNNIVQFHIGLFATLLATSCLQVILCGIQMINGLFGCLCGTCMDKEVSLPAAAAAFAKAKKNLNRDNKLHY